MFLVKLYLLRSSSFSFETYDKHGVPRTYSGPDPNRTVVVDIVQVVILLVAVVDFNIVVVEVVVVVVAHVIVVLVSFLTVVVV